MVKHFKHILKLSLLTAGFLFLNAPSFSQRCGTVEYSKILQQSSSRQESVEDFEKWISRKAKDRATTRTEAEVITIPIVFHVIHNGEPYGVGMNIPDEQLLSQIIVLNEDFRRLNPDREQTPTLFESVAADFEINFALALRDPEGLSTDGIIRLNGQRERWNLIDDLDLKSLSQWPPDQYLNIYVTDLIDYVGYAQFPYSDLDGLEDGGNSTLIDGIVLDYTATGSKDIFPSEVYNDDFDLGRTATHEIGHYFGLRHIWGDGGCSADDFCNDTPLQGSSNNGLANCSFPGRNSCDEGSTDLPDMFMNFMDYTDDVCMNLFTEDQKIRTRIILENSPRRKQLANSLGALPPIVANNDLGIRKIISPHFSACGDTFEAVIEIRNYGLEKINSATIDISFGSDIISITKQLNLEYLDIDTISFDNLSLPIEDFDILVEVKNVNGAADENNENDIKTGNVKIIPEDDFARLTITFNEFPDGWSIFNEDERKTWETISTDANQNALYLEFYDYDEPAIDIFSSPAFDLSVQSGALLKFDVAYANYPEIDNEGLLVTLGEGCGNPLTSDTIYFKTGSQLSTVASTRARFSPEEASEWRTESINLAPYLGRNDLQVSFIGLNRFGNNLYLDNISISRVISNIVYPSYAGCDTNKGLVVQVVNEGTEPVNQIEMTYSLDDRETVTQNFNLSEPLLPGYSEKLTIDLGTVDSGTHTLLVNLTLENQNPTVLEKTFHVDQARDALPIRENMENLIRSQWIRTGTDDTMWDIEDTNDNSYLIADHIADAQKDDKALFISPILDFSQASVAILSFEAAYEQFSTTTDVLSVLVSTDCGENFSQVEYSRFGSDLINTPSKSNINWMNELVNLSEYVGLNDVRLAFVTTDNNGGVFYLDDIQIFISDDTSVSESIIYPNPSTGRYSINFDLNEKENIMIQVTRPNGQVLLADQLSGVLNQVYTLDITDRPAGIYIIRIIGSSFQTSERVVKVE